MEWIATRSGGKLDLLDPQPDQIDIKDIATALSRLPRFAGHTTEFYSVAQHSFHCSCRCDEFPLEALMHDAHEAYMGDISRPLKQIIGPEWERIERRIQAAIDARFGLRPGVGVVKAAVKAVDNQMLVTERRWLMPPGPAWEGDWPEPFAFRFFEAHSPSQAAGLFLSRFNELMSRVPDRAAC